MVAKLEERLIPMKEGEGSRHNQGKDGQRTTFTFFKNFSIFFSEIDRITNSVKKKSEFHHIFLQNQNFLFLARTVSVTCRYHLTNQLPNPK
jgi:hypothetical protein